MSNSNSVGKSGRLKPKRNSDLIQVRKSARASIEADREELETHFIVKPIRDSNQNTSNYNHLRSREVLEPRRIIAAPAEGVGSKIEDERPTPSTSQSCDRNSTETVHRDEDFPNPMKYYLGYYWDCLHPSKPSNDVKAEVITATVKLIWCTVLLLAVCDSLVSLKDPFLELRREAAVVKRESRFVMFGMRIIQAILNCAFFYNLKLKSDKVPRMLTKLNLIRPVQCWWIPFLLFVFSCFVAVVCTVFGFGIVTLRTWNLPTLSALHYYEICDGFLTWGSKTSHICALESETVFHCLATVGYFCYFAYVLTELIMGDVFFVTVLTLRHEVCLAASDVQELLESIKNGNENGNELNTRSTNVRKDFDRLVDASKLLHSTFRVQFGLFHLRNMSLAASLLFFLACDFELGRVLWLIFLLLKSGIAYGFGISISDMAEIYDDWIDNKKARDSLELSESDLMALLHKMNESQIGIGSKQLYVGWTLIKELWGCTITVFLALFRAYVQQSM